VPTSRALPTLSLARSSAPSRSTCVTGVIYFNNVAYIGMCGHGTIGSSSPSLIWAASQPAPIASRPGRRR
jgi:proline racemase